MQFKCPKCHTAFNVRVTEPGARFQCPKCNQKFRLRADEAGGTSEFGSTISTVVSPPGYKPPGTRATIQPDEMAFVKRVVTIGLMIVVPLIVLTCAGTYSFRFYKRSRQRAQVAKLDRLLSETINSAMDMAGKAGDEKDFDRARGELESVRDEIYRSGVDSSFGERFSEAFARLDRMEDDFRARQKQKARREARKPLQPASGPATLPKGMTSLMASLQEIHDKAALAKAKPNLDQVYRLQQQRDEVLAAVAGLSNPRLSEEESQWIEDYRAIRNAEADIQALRYQDAYDLLKQRWPRHAQANTSGKPAYGDLALKMAEAYMSSLLIRPRPVADPKELQAALSRSLEIDPCQIEANVILAHLISPDPREAFTRAEVRPSLIARNHRLLNLSFHFQRRKSPGLPQPGAVGQAYPVVMPWQAAAEVLKAEGSAFVLKDYLYSIDFLAGSPLEGTDSAGARFVLFQKGFFVEDADKKGRPGWFLVLPRVTDDSVKWIRLSLQIARFKSSRETVQPGANRPQARPAGEDFLKNQLNAKDPLWSVAVEDGSFLLYGTENMEISHILQGVGAHWLAVVSDRKLEASLKQIKSEREAARPGAVHAPRRPAGRRAEAVAPAPPGYTLPRNVLLLDQLPPEFFMKDHEGEVTLQFGQMPLYGVLSSPEAFEPRLFEDERGGHGFLVLGDGARLQLDPETCSFDVDDGAVRMVQALSVRSVPLCLLDAMTEAGVLPAVRNAGYSMEEARQEAARMVFQPGYIPPRLKQQAGDSRGLPLKAETEARVIRYHAAGARFLIDGRGNCITTPAQLHYWSQAGASAGPSGGNYRMFNASGQELANPDVRYSEQDWRELWRNTCDVFMPHAFDLEPCFQVWLARYALMLPFGANLFPVAVEPLGKDMLSDFEVDLDEDWLGVLYRSVSSKLFLSLELDETGQARPADASRADRDRSTFGASRRSRGQLKAFTDMGPTYRAYWPKRLAWVAFAKRAAVEDGSKKKYHRALALYHDILDAMSLKSDIPLVEGLFETVPNPELLAKFSFEMGLYLQIHRVNLVAEMELARILEQAGLKESSAYVKNRARDRFKLYTRPVIEESINYAQGYGFSPPSDLAADQRALAELVETVSTELPGSDDQPACIQKALGATDAAGVSAKLGKIGELLGQKEPAAREEAKKKEFIGGLIAEVLDEEIALSTWVDLKNRLRTANSAYLWRIDGPRARAIAINLLPVDRYDADRGLTGNLNAILRGDLCKALKEWAGLSGTNRDESDAAGAYYFALGWYWMDRGDWSLAQEAYIRAARHYQAKAARLKAGPGAPKAAAAAGLVAERNLLVMLTTASGCMLQPPAGVPAGSGIYAGELARQALMWKRRWNSAGLSETQADREVSLLAGRLETVRRSAGALDNPLDRYFWFDCRGVPEFFSGLVKTVESQQAGKPAEGRQPAKTTTVRTKTPQDVEQMVKALQVILEKDTWAVLTEQTTLK
jgi:hypothetical protein